jgi:hypothetical protein
LKNTLAYLAAALVLKKKYFTALSLRGKNYIREQVTRPRVFIFENGLSVQNEAE